MNPFVEQILGWRNERKFWHNKKHRDRWDRVLVAIGETGHLTDLEISKITPMTYREISRIARGHWAHRWRKVKDELNKGTITINTIAYDVSVNTQDDEKSDIMTVSIETDDMSARTKSTYERENENLRKTISQKNREISRMMETIKGSKCNNCETTRLQALSDANVQANALHQKDLKINMLQKKVNDLVASFGDLKSQASQTAKTTGTIQKLEAMLDLTRKRAEQAENRNIKLETENEELTAKLGFGHTIKQDKEITKLNLENNDLRQKLHEAENKLADTSITYQDAITGLMQGRVLEPEIGTVSLTDKDKKDLERFADIWAVTIDTLPDIYVYGMKNKESEICKRHNIEIDDYGQPKTLNQEQDLARALSYMDMAISHAHQEFQAAVRMARILTGVKQ